MGEARPGLMAYRLNGEDRVGLGRHPASWKTEREEETLNHPLKIVSDFD
jgi:hypothetical protein